MLWGGVIIWRGLYLNNGGGGGGICADAHLNKAFVEAEVVPDAVLPPLLVLSVEGITFYNKLIYL